MDFTVPREIEDYYAELERFIEAEIEPLVARSTGAMLKREAFIFVSSPGAVTPFHIDPEHNILLQIEGRKTMNVYPADSTEMAGVITPSPKKMAVPKMPSPSSHCRLEVPALGPPTLLPCMPPSLPPPPLRCAAQRARASRETRRGGRGITT